MNRGFSKSADGRQTRVFAVAAFESVIAEHPFLRGLKPEHLRLLTDSAMRMRYERR
jgi:hypothetical protein